jgi:hypothetical protein
MKKIVISLLMLAVLPSAIYSDEIKMLPYGNGSIEFKIPAGFVCDQKAVNARGGEGLILTSPDSNAFKIEITADTVGDSMLNAFSREEIASINLRTIAEFYRPYALEAEINPVKISRNGYDAFSCELTDKRNDMPKEEFRYITIVSAVKDDAMIISVIHYPEKGSAVVAKAVDTILIGNVKNIKNPVK